MAGRREGINALVFPVLAMAAVVALSNFAVQYPVQGQIGPIALADVLTWGAFTYPLAFLVNDLTNRRFGVRAARRVVYAGFAVAVVLSIWLATPRIAIASGTAFLAGQLLDVTVFNWLRRQAWWRAPLAGSVIGSILDTALFFTLAFAPAAALLGPNDPFAIEYAPLFGALASDVPRWASWALGDLSVKLVAALALLIPYGALMSVIRPFETARG